MNIIHIEWEGPREIGRLDEFGGEHDKGLYQIYGDHPVYGRDVLLYIGKTHQQTFKERISQEGWDKDDVAASFRVGRLMGQETPRPEVWADWINLAERLMIHAHKPAYNARDMLTPPDPGTFSQTLVLNWDDRGVLLPEVSGARWSSEFHHWKGYSRLGVTPKY